MAQLAIVCDSSASIPEKIRAELDIRVVPIYIHHGDQVWRDLVDIRQEDFYAWLPTVEILPTTAYPGPGDFMSLYEELAAEGFKEIVSIHLTSKSSGTVEGAKVAAGMLMEKMRDVQIAVIDTLSVAMAHGWMVIEAARAALNGNGSADITALVNRMMPVTEMIQTADTLKYLQMGGRIGQAQYLVGNLLNIKPLIGMHDGVIVPLGRERSRAKAYQQMVNLVVDKVGSGSKIKVAYVHTAAAAETDQIRVLLEERVACVETIVAELSPALGVHSGPGATGICYFPAEVLES
jgi:DegV family protein with EDD domain